MRKLCLILSSIVVIGLLSSCNTQTTEKIKNTAFQTAVSTVVSTTAIKSSKITTTAPVEATTQPQTTKATTTTTRTTAKSTKQKTTIAKATKKPKIKTTTITTTRGTRPPMPYPKEEDRFPLYETCDYSYGGTKEQFRQETIDVFSEYKNEYEAFVEYLKEQIEGIKDEAYHIKKQGERYVCSGSNGEFIESSSEYVNSFMSTYRIFAVSYWENAHSHCEFNYIALASDGYADFYLVRSLSDYYWRSHSVFPQYNQVIFPNEWFCTESWLIY